MWLLGGGVLFALIFGFAAALDYLGGVYPRVFRAIGGPLLDTRTRDVAEAVAAAFCAAAGLAAPKLGWRWWTRLERRVALLASRRTAVLVAAGLLPVTLRLALLPVLPVPQPKVADEFGYLLLADTFASGRLTNPTHPFWKHFEAIYLFHHPTYTSIYPPAPAALMAIPQALGLDPWLGVCLGSGLLCALICWMLQAWVPPKWVLLGGALAVCRFSVFSPWMNTYWGGTVAAIGGALVIGALPRIVREWRVRDSILLAVGLVVLAGSRPYEGLLFSIPLVVWLLGKFLREARVRLGARLLHAAVPITVVLVAAVGWMAYYNWRVTGHPLLMPYLLHQKLYGTPQPFLWQAPLTDAPGIHGSRDIADVFYWQRDAYKNAFTWFAQGSRLASFWHFYFQPLFTVPLLFLPFFVRRRWMPVLLAAAALVLAGSTLYPFFFPHYAAPICGLTVLLVIQGLRQLRAWRPAGAAVFRLLLICIFASALLTAGGEFLEPWSVDSGDTPRAEVARYLEQRGGKHLVLVRYGSKHSFHDGIVYNRADIDRSPVVWARSLDEASNGALSQYYHDRDVWLFNPDAQPVRLEKFTEGPYIMAVADAAGLRDSSEQGVSPGAIAVIIGRNFTKGRGGVSAPGLFRDLPLRLDDISEDQGIVFAPASATALPVIRPQSIGTANLAVQFGGYRAPILAVSENNEEESITVQVPANLPLGQCTVTLQANGYSAERRVLILPATPGIFQLRMSDSRFRGILIHPAGTLVDLEHPARRGEELRLLTTGIGPLEPSGLPVYKVIVGVNHGGVIPLATESPLGTPGVQRIVFRVPGETPAGKEVPLSLGVVVAGKIVYSNKSSFPVAP